MVIYSLGQHSSHQFVCLLPLHLQLLCPLPDQVLKVGWVLLQHAQHWVYNVCLLPFGNALKLQDDRDKQSCHTPELPTLLCWKDATLHKTVSYLFEDLLESRPPLRLLTPGLFHHLDHIQRSLIHRQDGSAQRRRLFDLADNLWQCASTQERELKY